MISAEAHRTFGRFVGAHPRFVIVTHVHPDGDALGSQVGLARYLGEAGREVVVVSHDPVPRALSMIDLAGLDFRVFHPASDEPLIRDAAALVLLDNSAPDRLGRLERPMLAAAARTLCIDHHPTRGTPWAENILDVGSCATAAMVYELARERGWRPAPNAAEALFVGLATDTGFFRFNSTSPDALRVAAELLEAGAEPARCYRHIHERNSPEYTRLLGAALAGLDLDAGGAIASVRIPLAMSERHGGRDIDTSEMTTPLLAIEGVRIAALFRELPGGRVKVSLRSKGTLDVHGLASEFGGGGHRNASGIVTEGPLEEVVRTVLARATALVQNDGAAA